MFNRDEPSNLPGRLKDLQLRGLRAEQWGRRGLAPALDGSTENHPRIVCLIAFQLALEISFA